MSRSNKSTVDQLRSWWPVIKRGLRKAIQVTGIGLAVMVLFGVVFWDADFYAARDRWETFKHAIFGEWEGSVVEGVDTKKSVQADLDVGAQVELMFSGYDSVHLFATKAIEGTTSVVDTGARFNNVADILTGDPTFQWCDVANQASAVKHRVQIANKSKSFGIKKSDINGVTTAELELLGINRAAFLTLPRTHCQFDFFIKE